MGAGREPGQHFKIRSQDLRTCTHTSQAVCGEQSDRECPTGVDHATHNRSNDDPGGHDMGSCIKCGRHWTGLAQAHCAAAGCHQHFSTVANFDRHRPGAHCQRAGYVLGHDGQPLLKPVTNRFGITWVQNKERPDDLGQDEGMTAA